MDKLTDQMYPFSIPPFCTFAGNVSANHEKWRLTLGPVIVEETVDVTDPKLAVPTMFNITLPIVRLRLLSTER